MVQIIGPDPLFFLSSAIDDGTAPQLAKWPQALSLGLLPQNLESTAKRIALLADELCFVASQGGGGSVEAGVGKQEEDALDWYAQRATMGSVYVATELFFLTDYSEDHSDTWCVLDDESLM